MITKQTLKDIIVSNKEFILNKITSLMKRGDVHTPTALNKVVIFYGVRRSGKTFMLFDLFKRHKDNALYIDFEDERLAGFQSVDFEKLKNSFLELNPALIDKEMVFLLDEVQNVEGWERFCRRAVERENIRIFVSGSSSKVMPFEIHTELRGRSWSIEVLPFSFLEYLSVKGINVKDKTHFYGRRGIVIKSHFAEYLKWGGFPEVSMLKSEFDKIKLLREYFGAMFFKDLVERYAITNISLIESLTDKLFSSFSSRLSLSAFYKQYKDRFPFSKDLLFKYYKHFLQSMLVYEVRKFAESTYKRMRNPAKIYLIDTGLCRRVSSEDTGRLLENMVFLELKRRNYEVFYFEEKMECDFIAKTQNNQFNAIQVTFELNEHNTERETKGLIAACKHLDIKEGTILTYDEEGEIEKEGIKINIIPFWRWTVGI